MKNVGPIRHCEPPHAAKFYIAIHQVSLLSHAACASMSTTTTTTRDRGDRYGPMEWAQRQDSESAMLVRIIKSIETETFFMISSSLAFIAGVREGCRKRQPLDLLSAPAIDASSCRILSALASQLPQLQPPPFQLPAAAVSGWMWPLTDGSQSSIISLDCL